MVARYALFLAGSVALAACAKKEPPPAPAPPPPPAPVVVKEVPTIPIERPAAAMRESGGLVLGKVGGAEHAFVADEDDDAILEIDPATKAVVATTKLEARPRDLLVLGDGRLAATLPDANAVLVFAREETGGLREVARAKTPADPQSLALDASDAMLYVSTGAGHSLVGLDAKALDEEMRVPLGREPRAVLVNDDRVFVAHALEDHVSVVAKDGAVTTRKIGNHATCAEGSDCVTARTARNAQAIIRTGEHAIVVPAAQSLPKGGAAFSKRALCPPPPPPNPDGTRAKLLAPSTERVGYGSGSEDNGPPVTADLPILDTSSSGTGKWSTANPPQLGAGCLLPRAGVSMADGSVLVACLGSARVNRYTPTKGDEWNGPINFAAKGRAPADHFANGVIPNVSTVTIAVPAGPTAIALDAKGDALVWSTFTRTLTRIVGKTAATVLEVPRAKTREQAWLRGRELFFSNTDTRISHDGRACGSCHVDGLDDGLTWKTPDGPRRTRFLRGEAQTGPYGWKGEHATLAEHIASTMKNLGGTGLPPDALTDLSAYVSTLARPKPSKDESAELARGKELFKSAECSHCHAAGGSDRKVHDVGTGGGFMTPTLVSAGTRRELMHDGRFKNLDELIAGAPSMGRGASLSPEERRALALYLETL